VDSWAKNVGEIGWSSVNAIIDNSDHLFIHEEKVWNKSTKPGNGAGQVITKD